MDTRFLALTLIVPLAGLAAPSAAAAQTAASVQGAGDRAEPVMIPAPGPGAVLQAPDPALAVQAEDPPALPLDVAELLRAAIEAGDEAGVNSIARYALRAFPDAGPEIQAIRADFNQTLSARREAAAEERRRQLASPRLLDNWEGRIELGASRNTGNVSSYGLYGSIEAERKGLKWDNAVSVRAEVQETNGVRSAERISAAWRPRYRLDDHLNLSGLTQYERDPILRIGSRYTAAAGLGMLLVDESDMNLRVDGGPALRHTETTDGLSTTALGGRASLDFDWKITPTLQLKQNGSFIMDGGNESGRATTAIETQLFGSVRARLSYELRYERNSATGVDRFGTSGRTTIVVGL